MNVKQSTIDALYNLITGAFEMNRAFDRMVSVLGVNFACNHSSGLIHKGIAHYFPNFSDLIGERCLERYNINVEYGETPEGKQDYARVTDIIQNMEDKGIEYQNMVIGACKVALDNGDLQIYSDLSDLLRDYNKIVEQLILLNDKIQKYGEDRIMSFDHDIDTFWNL